jgi:hypothetical protein
MSTLFSKFYKKILEKFKKIKNRYCNLYCFVLLYYYCLKIINYITRVIT